MGRDQNLTRNDAIVRPWKTVLAGVLCAAACSQPASAQVGPPAILQIDIENAVMYVDDTPDLSKFATASGITPAMFAANFNTVIIMADIVAVNGQPARGTLMNTGRRITSLPTASAGAAIADTTRNGRQEWVWEILNTDSTPIGTIMAGGLGGGLPPPGAPLQSTQGNNAVVGGTGAFFGVRGVQAQAVTPQSISLRQASMVEDPGARRRNGGGRQRHVLHIIPMEWPQVVTTSSGPAVFHADFSPVTTAKPAKAGEVLILFASGLGPTRPGVDPGQPFTADPLHVVNSPVQVMVNGKGGDLLYAGGYPGTVDSYQVNFRVPDGTASGPASLQLTAAWIAGPSVSIPVQ